MDNIGRVKCLLQSAISMRLCRIEESYKEWCEENRGEGEGEGEETTN
jgi:hypothetical protein